MGTSRASLVQAARRLGRGMERLAFEEPVTHVYNPLDYAWEAHRLYLELYGSLPKRVLFLGMNPGPFGMAQTGVPFGEVAAVRDWMQISAPVRRPDPEHPKRPVQGFDCPRSEVSGRRLWGLFADRFGKAAAFFEEHFVVNYCPLAFLEASGRNFTPNKLPRETRESLQVVCDEHLRTVVDLMKPEWLVGVGDYAFKCLDRVFGDGEASSRQHVRIAHPSPASPAANKDWAGLVTRQLTEAGVWD